MVRAKLEAEAPLGTLGHRLEQVVRSLDRRAAHLADEVAVGLGRQVVGRRAVPEVGVDDDAEALELLEVAIHRGGVDVGRERANRDEQLLGGRDGWRPGRAP